MVIFSVVGRRKNGRGVGLGGGEAFLPSHILCPFSLLPPPLSTPATG